MSATPTEAAVLVGGLGSRLSGVILDRPKPMALVNGRPFLAYLVEQLRQQKFRRLVMCTGHLGEKVEEYFGDGSSWGIQIAYSHEDKPLGTGGALRQALDWIEADRLFALNGDSYCSFDAHKMWLVHQRGETLVTVLLAEVLDVSRFGSVRVSARGTVTSFVEKNAKDGPGMVSAGVYLIEKEVVSAMEPNRSISLEREILPNLPSGTIRGVAGSTQLLDIGTPESFASAQQELPTLLLQG